MLDDVYQLNKCTNETNVETSVSNRVWNYSKQVI